MRYTFAVVGGDMRLARLAARLAAMGHTVRRFGSQAAPSPATARSLEEAAAGADCAILPLPLCVREGFLNAPLAPGPVPLEGVFRALAGVPLVCAGRVDAISRETAERCGVALEDYFEREELAVMNAVATAEGAVMLAMEDTDGTLCGADVLVTGYGRIGRILSQRLTAMGARVTVAARSAAARAWAAAFGCVGADTAELPRLLRRDVIFNTVPAPLFTQSVVEAMDPRTLLIDLASKPGGVDFDAASRLGRRVVWALSLPGEVAPEAAGAAIGETVLNMLAERGCGA